MHFHSPAISNRQIKEKDQPIYAATYYGGNKNSEYPIKCSRAYAWAGCNKKRENEKR
jgi:hypothetical protein